MEHLTCSLGTLAHSKQRRLRTARVLNFGNQKEFWMYTCSFVHSLMQLIKKKQPINQSIIQSFNQSIYLYIMNLWFLLFISLVGSPHGLFILQAELETHPGDIPSDLARASSMSPHEAFSLWVGVLTNQCGGGIPRSITWCFTLYMQTHICLVGGSQSTDVHRVYAIYLCVCVW